MTDARQPAPADPEARRRALRRLAIFGAVVTVVFVAALGFAPESAREIRDTADGLGAAGPILFVLAATALTLALFPFPVLAAAGGLLFGTAGGTAVGILAPAAGAVLAFLATRRYGADAFTLLASERARRLLASVERRGFVAVLYLRIAPGIPRNLCNYALGLTSIGLGPYTLASVLGIAPRAYAYAAIGSTFTLDDLDAPEAQVAFGALVALALFGMALLVYEEKRRPPPSAPSNRT